MKRSVLAIVLLTIAATTAAAEWRGNIAADYQWYANEGAYPMQEDSYLSLAIEPEFFHDWNDGYDLFTFKTFYREDQHDDERSHGDVRELSWLHATYDWETVVGIGKVFWGVTESIHLVDIINQTDLVENLDGEDKLGQPMIQYTLIKDWGVLSGFVLPYFRERTFPGAAGRPRFGLVVDADNAVYEDSDEEKHIDVALRYTHTLGDWDIGLAYFTGTSREPRYIFNGPTQPLTPYYDIINQASLTLQASIGSWLWKLEAINRVGQGETFAAAAGGFEYTFVGVFESDMDVGFIMEYLYDERDSGFDLTSAPLNLSSFQNDLVLAARLTFNDAQSTEVLASLIGDLDGNGLSYNIEASRRFGDNTTLSLEARGVSDPEPGTALDQLAEDNRVRLELAVYF